jgi:hypothetical protein
MSYFHPTIEKLTRPICIFSIKTSDKIGEKLFLEQKNSPGFLAAEKALQGKEQNHVTAPGSP